MILLSAFKIDSGGRFSYRLEPDRGAPVATDNDKLVAKSLLSLGVEGPDRLIAHARTWGSVEIVEPIGIKSLKKRRSLVRSDGIAINLSNAPR